MPSDPMQPEAFEHLFRREYGRMVATVTRVFGVRFLALAEDVVQDAFCRALEVWKHRGVPDQPAAWLMATARNRALDHLRRRQTERLCVEHLGQSFDDAAFEPAFEKMFAPGAIKDDLLRMMFSCCHPKLTEDAQVALILHILCGFSVDEIASAFMSTYASIEKRIPRAKKVLAASRALFDLDSHDSLSARLPAVQRALYLLFNEGYHGASAETAVRRELCLEAIRLANLLLDHPRCATPCTRALAALMRLHIARLPTRVDAAGNLSRLSDQDRTLWNRALITEGFQLLEQSATGTVLSAYHVEAAIAAVHATAARAEDTDWASIVSLYDMLLTIQPSPVVALNRAIAIGQLDGPNRGLVEIRSIEDHHRLQTYPFFFAAVGEFERRCGNLSTAQDQFHRALALARNPAERAFFEQQVLACGVANN